ncbi:hypothetical protein BDF14DRAFT_1728626 [Spinellus fusiger]|nr:hypothetical protein BDF14DRAFT_1728626 [Spinellus fusiger]
MVYLSSDPDNNKVYENKLVSMNDIITIVWKYKNLFQDKNVSGFGKWVASVIEDNVEYREQYQDQIKNLTNESYRVIGYTRKSKGAVKD